MVGGVGGVSMKGTAALQRRLHPWIDVNVTEHLALVGRVTDDGAGVQIITSEGEAWDAADEEVLHRLAFRPRPWPNLIGRWRGDDVVEFLMNPTAPTFGEVFALVVRALGKYLEFPRRWGGWRWATR